MTQLSESQHRLAKAAREIANEKLHTLQKYKDARSEIERPDFLWHYLLQSFATMGRSAGLEDLLGNPDHYKQLRYDVLAALSPNDREAQVRRICRASRRLRMPDLKASYIIGCFDQIEALGGLEAAKSLPLAERGYKAKIAFLKTFPGIGDKYSRNLLMDVYHEDFHDSIAIDTRIKAISDLLGLPRMTYDAHEAFYLAAARSAGLNGWELDRLMYNYRDEFLSRLAIAPSV